MDYQKIYNNLIELGRIGRTVVEFNEEIRKYEVIDYREEHHIIPDCFFIDRMRTGRKGWLEGDPDDPSNLVRLTAAEHYVAHQLLIKIYPDCRGIIHAAKMMTVDSH